MTTISVRRSLPDSQAAAGFFTAGGFGLAPQVTVTELARFKAGRSGIYRIVVSVSWQTNPGNINLLTLFKNENALTDLPLSPPPGAIFSQDFGPFRLTLMRDEYVKVSTKATDLNATGSVVILATPEEIL
jgi:hypothetical protein